MRILQLVSCRGWSSDAYWAARVTRELERRGHEVTLGCRRGTEKAVIDRARGEGVKGIVTFALASGLEPASDVADVRRLLAWLRAADVVHVHRGKEHWLAAVANCLSLHPRPIVRTRHIVQAVRPHPANRWLYRRATALVVTVTEAIGHQLVAAGLVAAERVVALQGGADAETYRPRPPDPVLYRRLGGDRATPLVGMIAGVRPMKGHQIVIDAAAQLARSGVAARFAFVGRGTSDQAIRQAIRRAGLERQFALVGFIDDLPAAMGALDLALYVPLESDGMSRVLFECMAAGRPLIASRVGAVPEVLVDGEHALLVPAGDADELASALVRALGDPGLCTRLGESARQLVSERYSGARLAAALETHYRRLASV
ncbi:MAG: glycosyltransferase family 4 protein [Candidatus Rokubacteria bacterium]|nr:glycosyltransferase family 4 protein [Candidatus Rokubacteria bacterium]